MKFKKFVPVFQEFMNLKKNSEFLDYFHQDILHSLFESLFFHLILIRRILFLF
jgi:hypothetical protein